MSLHRDIYDQLEYLECEGVNLLVNEINVKLISFHSLSPLPDSEVSVPTFYDVRLESNDRLYCDFSVVFITVMNNVFKSIKSSSHRRVERVISY